VSTFRTETENGLGSFHRRRGYSLKRPALSVVSLATNCFYEELFGSKSDAGFGEAAHIFEARIVQRKL
jgi:hypothetical protein